MTQETANLSVNFSNANGYINMDPDIWIYNNVGFQRKYLAGS